MRCASEFTRHSRDVANVRGRIENICRGILALRGAWRLLSGCRKKPQHGMENGRRDASASNSYVETCLVLESRVNPPAIYRTRYFAPGTIHGRNIVGWIYSDWMSRKYRQRR